MLFFSSFITNRNTKSKLALAIPTGALITLANEATETLPLAFSIVWITPLINRPESYKDLLFSYLLYHFANFVACQMIIFFINTCVWCKQIFS